MLVPHSFLPWITQSSSFGTAPRSRSASTPYHEATTSTNHAESLARLVVKRRCLPLARAADRACALRIHNADHATSGAWRRRNGLPKSAPNCLQLRSIPAKAARFYRSHPCLTALTISAGSPRYGFSEFGFAIEDTARPHGATHCRPSPWDRICRRSHWVAGWRRLDRRAGFLLRTRHDERDRSPSLR